MNILLTGGTGFIGSHTAVELITRGHKAVLYDNLCNSDAAVVDALEKITGKRPLLVVGDIRDTEKLQAVLIAEKIDVVIHFAGLKAVGQQQIKAAIGHGKAEIPLHNEIKKRPAGQDAGKQHIPADGHSGKDAQQRPQLDRHRKGCVRSHRTPAF